jgi:outer membrane lipoprotein-sorting protein
MKIRFTVIITILYAAFMAYASKASSSQLESEIAPIQKVIEKYNKAKAISAKVEKLVYLTLLEETKSSKGEMYFSKGKIRLEMASPDNSVMVVGDGVIWLESDIEGLDDNKKHVTRIRSLDLNRQMRAPLAVLFGRAKAWEEFNVKSKNKSGDTVALVLEPKDLKAVEIKAMTVVVDTKKEIVTELEYSDAIENKITFKFNNIKIVDKVDAKKFNYVPPKGAEVVNF